jgi:hypothetical protein
MKKTTLFITVLLTSAFSFAQLNVRNNAFVFVNDEVLFVTEEVNIQETTANLYLRNEAQLLQGASQSVTNRGEGKLSVFQEGEASVFTHNIWASPVGTFNSLKGSYTATGNTPFIPEDNIFEVGTDLDGSMMPTALAPITSFPVTFIDGYNSNGNSTANTTATIGTGDDLEIARYWFWKFGPSFGGSTDYAAWSYVGQDGDVESGYGFTMKGTDVANQQYDFRGRPNSGTITTDLVYIPRNAGIQVPSFTMIGNPYPSALDTRDFIHDVANTNLYVDVDPAISNGTLYYWEQQDTGTHNLVGYSAGYAAYTISPGGVPSFVDAIMKTYNADGTVATTGAATGAGKTVGRYLPIGQGFMVRAAINSVDPDIGLSYTVEFNNSQREYIKESSGSSIFFKTSNTKNGKLSSEESLEEQNLFSYNDKGFLIVPSDFKRFRINVDFNDTYTRQLLHNFHDSTTEGKDYGFETELPSTLDSDIWWPRLGEKLNGNANKFDMELRVPLHLNLSAQQSVKFRALDIQNFDIDQPIFIHDKELDLYYDLTIQDYEIALATGDYSNRFEVTFMDNTKQIDLVVEELDEFNVFQNNNTSTLNLLNPRETNVLEINVYDVAGKRIFNTLKMNTQERFEISTRDLSEGVYVVKVDFTNGTSKSKKIIVSQN